MTVDERFDIVDENNHPLGFTKSRADVHRENKDWHRITAIWVHNDKKQLLCQQRSFKKDVYPGMWMLTFGGHLKAGETYEQNVLNEIREELNLQPQMNDLTPLGYYKTERHKHHAQMYVYRWNGRIEDLKFTDGEVEQVKWTTLEEYQQLIDDGENAYPVNPVLAEYIRAQS